MGLGLIWGLEPELEWNQGERMQIEGREGSLKLQQIDSICRQPLCNAPSCRQPTGSAPSSPMELLINWNSARRLVALDCQ